MKKIQQTVSAILVVFILAIVPIGASAATAVDNAVSWALSIAANSSHGYDQTYRWGPNYDCSSFVITAYQNAGVPVKTNGATATGSMYNPFIKSGFKDVTSSITLSSGKGLQKGDVLLQPGSHTVMVSSVNGSNITIVHASINENGKITGGKTGDQTGKEICTRTYYNKPWKYVLRYGGTNTTSPSTTYYAKYTGYSGSIVTALNAIGVDSSYANRAKIAAANGIAGYTGTAAQNTKMLTLLKSGTLKKAGTTSTIAYYAKYTGSSGSIVTALNAIGADSSYANRAKIAAANGISGYTGTAAQNTKMLALLKAGTLKKP